MCLERDGHTFRKASLTMLSVMSSLRQRFSMRSRFVAPELRQAMLTALETLVICWECGGKSLRKGNLLMGQEENDNARVRRKIDFGPASVAVVCLHSSC